jgi:hypothetical protein
VRQPDRTAGGAAVVKTFWTNLSILAAKKEEGADFDAFFAPSSISSKILFLLILFDLNEPKIRKNFLMLLPRSCWLVVKMFWTDESILHVEKKRRCR